MIFVTGDTHGDIDIHKLTTKFFNKKLTKDDYLIVCGDFGVIWSGTKKDNYLINWYNNKPWTTLFVDGNHENFDALYKYPVEEFHGGKVHKISDSIYHLMRGQIYNIEGKSFFTFGGALSMDKWSRKEGVSWWSQEQVSYSEADEALSNLDLVGNKVDYIITHTCPENIVNLLVPYDDVDPTSKFLTAVQETVDFKKWYFGHMHQDRDFGKYECLYNLIKEIK